MTPADNEPATFRTVAQHLSHCATAVPGYGLDHRQIMIRFQVEARNFFVV